MCHFTPSGLLIKRKRRHHVNWWYKVWSVVSMCDVHCCPWCWYDCLDTIWSFHLIITDDEHLPCDQLNMQNIIESVAKNSKVIHLCFKYTRCSVCDWIKASRPLQEFMYVRICWQRLEESSNAAEKPTYCLFLWRQNPACQPDLRCHVVNPPSHLWHSQNCVLSLVRNEPTIWQSQRPSLNHSRPVLGFLSRVGFDWSRRRKMFYWQKRKKKNQFQ